MVGACATESMGRSHTLLPSHAGNRDKANTELHRQHHIQTVLLTVRVELHSIAGRYTHYSEPFVEGLVCTVPEWTGSAFPTRSPNLVPTGSE